MGMEEERPLNQYRMSARGLEPLTQAHDRELGGRHRGLGLKDTKKVAVLGVLAAACIGVVAFQFLRGRSPAAAEASLAVPLAERAGTASTDEIDAVLKKLEAQRTGEDDLSVTRVEDLIREFDGYVRQRQVPLSALRANPFVVALPPPPEATLKSVPDKPDPAAEKEAAEAARRERIRQAASALSLGTIVISGEDRLAVVGGKVCRVGDVVGAFQVTRIEPAEVVVECEGEAVTLALFGQAGAKR